MREAFVCEGAAGVPSCRVEEVCGCATRLRHVGGESCCAQSPTKRHKQSALTPSPQLLTQGHRLARSTGGDEQMLLLPRSGGAGCWGSLGCCRPRRCVGPRCCRHRRRLRGHGHAADGKQRRHSQRTPQLCRRTAPTTAHSGRWRAQQGRRGARRRPSWRRRRRRLRRP